jgi:hypothetical protein
VHIFPLAIFRGNMTIEKFAVKLFRDPQKGSGRLYLKKELMQLLNFEEKKDLHAEYDTEKKVLTIREM